MKKLILPLLFFISCATYSPINEKLSIEKAEENATFVLNVLQKDSASLECKEKENEIICTSTDKENKTTVLLCNNSECVLER